MIYSLPKVVAWSELKELGFYDFRSLSQCLLKSMHIPKSLKISSAMPPALPNKPALIGRFHHKVMELLYSSNNIQELNNSIEEEIVTFQKEVDRFPHLQGMGSVSGWDEINYAASNALQMFSKLKKNDQVLTLGSEKTLVSKDGFFIGRPDFFIIFDKKAILKEYKTSSLYSDTGSIKIEYKDQLLFYAMLLYENFSIDLISANLISTRDGNYQLDITKSEAENFRLEAVESLKLANRRILEAKKAHHLAQNNSDACSYCDKRLICDLFKKNQKNLNLKKDAYILEGTVLEILNGDGAHTSLLKIQTKESKDIEELLVPKMEANVININDFYAFSDLYLQAEKFRWGERSRVHHA